MKLLLFLTLLLLACDGAGAAESRAKLAALQPWLNGLTAVTGFLLLAFGALVVHRLVKSRRSGKRAEPDEPDYEKQTSL
ncbi:small integral membrane protein 24 [Salarias fasciatus]|uniref:small integral membrane protein 24 n=1 Tax=Salarias fasciatus TaxID=181472 RepID=UPI001176F262|nr:small integral membrane protein 24-like [Salarias fasciatus]